MIWEQWLYQRRIFSGPLILMLLPLVIEFFALIFVRVSYSDKSWNVISAIGLLFSMAFAVLSMVAICWTGMWFGLKARTQAIAVLQTMAWVKVLPYLLSNLWMLGGRVFVMKYTSSPGVPNYVTFFVISWLPQILILLFLLGLIRSMRRRLLGEIRDAEALSLSFRGGYVGGWSGLRNWFRRVRHWTPS